MFYICKMNRLVLEDLESWYDTNKEEGLKGLRILHDDIRPIIEELNFSKALLGKSESGIDIFKICFGNGPKKILIWSQMHGNESTGTKALFDLFKFLSDNENKTITDRIKEKCTIAIIPMLNPDGAIVYTRENANGVDLNRDAVDRKAVESNLLREELDAFNPHFCFNLHDQRTIFNVEGTKNPATLSFLAPSINESRKITKGRTETMSVIASINDFLQECIPNMIGRYTDEFYPTATGDNFQKLNHNTVLFEAGHYPNDYNREVTRKYNFYAILQGLYFLASTDDYSEYETYFDIPQNDKKYFDKLYKNTENKGDVGVLYKYRVVDGNLDIYEEIDQEGDLSGYFGYEEYDYTGKKYIQ